MAQNIPVANERGLPPGCTVDDVIHWPEEAARWFGRSVRWCIEHRHEIPGVIEETRETVLFHPRTYLDKRLPTSGNQ